MTFPRWLGKMAQPGVERFFDSWPQQVPSREKVQRCKIVSHRGDFDNSAIFENTIPAFDRVLKHGVWGIELDVRWTKDSVPIVSHDADCLRLFGSPAAINRMTLEQLKNNFPLIPTLEETIRRYGKKLHLMAEIKSENSVNLGLQNEILEQHFLGLTAESDFHLISLDPTLFEKIDFVPRSARVLVAEANVHSLSDITLKKNYGGIAGHYYLLNRPLIEKHRDNNQKIGTGFPSSKNCLYREINREVDWIFSDNAIALQSICNQLLKE